MNITRKNYEAYIIDYLDGRLDPVQSTELMYFLSQNPDLEKEFKEFENIKINSSNELNLDKELLKKDFSDIEEINNENFDEFCIARFEGDLNDHDELRLKEYLKRQPEKQKDYDLYSETFLSPDYSITYSEKKSIKKASPFLQKKNLFIYVTSVAAAVLLLLLLIYMPGKESKVNTITQVVENKTKEDISSQKGLKNNIVINEKMTPKEQKFKPLYNIRNKQVAEKTSDNLPKDKKDDRMESLDYLNPIKAQLINAGENIDFIMNTGISANDNLFESKVAMKESTNKDLENINDYSIPQIILNRLNLWAVAEVGIKGFNYLTESEVLLSKQINTEGEVVNFALNAESFSISTPLKK
jgi:hypothetical protein